MMKNNLLKLAALVVLASCGETSESDKTSLSDSLTVEAVDTTKTAIIDANVTTLITAIILFFMGSGPVKGFSVTLAVGIFTTLFSVYFIARLLTVLYVSKNKEKQGLI